MALSATGGVVHSGLAAATRRLGASAHNVANLQTAGFVPQRVVTHSLPHGGVSTEMVPAQIPEDPRPGAPPFGPSSHVDLAFETVERISASASFRANLAVLETLDETEEALLDVLA